MYEAIKTVIRSGKYELTGLLMKIDILWVDGSLNDDQRLELIDAARESASARQSMDIYAKLAELDRSVKANAAAIQSLQSGSGTTEVDAYPEYAAGKWYYGGDNCTFEGIQYVCTAPEGKVCTWSPRDYPAYWKAVEG